MLSKISMLILRLAGWKIIGDVPEEAKKNIMIAGPHTSSWDFPLGLLVRRARKLNVSYLGKDSLFKPPFGFFFKWTGGIPVDRSSRQNMVDGLVKEYQKRDELSIVLAPEGTRKKVDRLKTGFYHIARGANVPMILLTFDYGRKVVTFEAPRFLSENKEEEMQRIWNAFKNVKGKNPEFGIH